MIRKNISAVIYLLVGFLIYYFISESVFNIINTFDTDIKTISFFFALLFFGFLIFYVPFRSLSKSTPITTYSLGLVLFLIGTIMVNPAYNIMNKFKIITGDGIISFLMELSFYLVGIFTLMFLLPSLVLMLGSEEE